MHRILVERGIGLDLDNTIVDYAPSFARAAQALGLADLPDKTAFRDALRLQPDGEQRWREVQADVYGPGMKDARAFPGVASFFARARQCGVALRVISHKSRTAAARPDVDLRKAALAWLEAQPFAAGVPVTFAATRKEKCAEIAVAGVALFIDDLVEVFGDAGFPAGVERWLFAPSGAERDAVADRTFATWDAMSDAAFGD